jgi:hypothetical protein
MAGNMSPNERIEPRLLQEIARLEAAGQQEVPIPIIIQFAGDLGPLAPPDVQAHDEVGKTRAQADRQDLLQRLAAMGDARNLQYLVLANAVETRLATAQIREIAGHPDVKLILWNREERVTA